MAKAKKCRDYGQYMYAMHEDHTCPTYVKSNGRQRSEEKITNPTTLKP